MMHQNLATLGPPVVRALKPTTYEGIGCVNMFKRGDFATLNKRDPLIEGPSDNSRRNSSEDEQIYYYMPPVNTTGGLGCVHSTYHPPLLMPASSFEHASICYIDLDLPKTTSPTTKSNTNGSDFEAPHASENHISDKHDTRY